MAAMVEGPADDNNGRAVLVRAPPTYLGHARSDQLPSTNGAGRTTQYAYELPERLPSNQSAHTGTWAHQPESVVLGEAGGSIAYRVHADDAHLVRSSGTFG